jgi:hypothetical protein
MPIKDPDNVNWTVVIYLFIITSLGSLSNYCHHLLNGDRFNIWGLIARIFISTFAGVLVALTASYFNWEFEFAGGVAGVAGWSGTVLIKALENKLTRKVKGDDL